MAKQVLVVDDDPATVTLVTEAFTAAGFSVSSVTDGAACLATLAERLPDLLVLDIMLPGMSGIEVLAWVRGTVRTQHLPVILLTARDQTEDKVKGWMSGTDRYITKPFSPRELVAAAQQVLYPPARL